VRQTLMAKEHGTVKSGSKVGIQPNCDPCH
jgi:hypothetical protein